jgi:lipooligosaccharide transport system permease protein
MAVVSPAPAPTARRRSPWSSAMSLRAMAYWNLVGKRTWRGQVVSTVLAPILFLGAMGLGLGSYVDDGGSSASLGGVDYLAFLAPGLLAASAMQAGAMAAMYPVMGAIKWIRTYDAMLATPLRVVDVVLGHLAHMAVRLVLTSAIFIVVMTAFGATESGWVVLTLPAAVLTGMAFATPLTAFSATREKDGAFAGVTRFVIMPMFLFSGTFFPITQLPAGIRWIAYLTPLWHGVALCRTLALGTATPWGTALHVAVLTALTVAGTYAALVAFRRRLTP